jgi:hypothetical protein
MNKFIFLDIDGVLATPACIKGGLWALCDDKQQLLGEILESTEANIVLSSSWRTNDLESTKEYMSESGFNFVDKIVGITVRAYQLLSKDSIGKLSIPRGVEINKWLYDNVHYQPSDYRRMIVGEDFTYVILDDDSDMLLEQSPYFIKTNSREGLTDDQVASAIKILNG